MEERIVVITGASSGIGRATAIRLARSGANLVLAARNKKALMAVAEECQNYGVEAIVVVTDVTDEEAVKRLAEKAIDRFGSINVWINNAGVTALGSVNQIPSETFRRVMDTNYFGCVYGTKAAIKQFKVQQYGTLINIASVLGSAPIAYESPYVASKFAVEGFTASVREEIYAEDYLEIHVCSVLPATINTPIYRNAANYSGRQVLPLQPIYAPAQMSEALTDLIDHPRPKMVVGLAGHGLRAAKTLLPTKTFDQAFGAYSNARHFKDDPAAVTDGNLYEQSKETGISGGWDLPSVRPTKLIALAAVGAVAGLAVFLLAKKQLKIEA